MKIFFFTPKFMLHRNPISVKISGKYIQKNLIKYGDPTYVETFMDPIRMIQIFMDLCAIDNNVKKWTVM